MKCVVNCKCTECENLMLNEPIVFIKQYGLDEKRETLVGVKCRRYGVYSETVDGLKTSELLDNIIWLD